MAGALAACSPGEEAAPSDTSTDPSATSAEPSTSAPASPSPSPSDTSESAPTESESVAPTEPTEPTDEAPAPEDFSDFGTTDQTSDGWPVHGPDTYLTEVRAAAHEGYDRVVLQFRGSEPPSHDVRYVDEATGDGSGLPLDVEGETFLYVGTAIVLNPYDVGDPEDSVLTGPGDIGDATISGLFAEGPWEGHSATYIGLDRTRDFRVTTLTDPARIVVDIRR
ncbi:hypothetical protein SERN_1165 [Serinibacter arcticus]|uniref:AMIN-like domain-containing protein n=1 Tax=Serinibacter arcticus TaxID=1655435 RepID=A0A4Z1E6A0_9MICO|nr:hypothetical protein SERN_1165 [Serinibacter arcticus]